MSASNWAVCPRCRDRARKAEDEAFVAVMALYGTVPVAEFDAKRAELTRADDEDFVTLREDYEFHGAEDGEVRWSYGCCCSVCGLETDLKGSRKFYEAES